MNFRFTARLIFWIGLAWGNAQSGEHPLYTFEESILPNYYKVNDLIAYDYDSDGVDEIIVVSYSESNQTSVMIMKQNGQLIGEIKRLSAVKVKIVDIVRNPRAKSDDLWLQWSEDGRRIIAAYELPQLTYKTQTSFDFQPAERVVINHKNYGDLPYKILEFTHGGEGNVRMLFALDYSTLACGRYSTSV